MDVFVYCPAIQRECDRDDCIGSRCARIMSREEADQRWRESQLASLDRMSDDLLIEALRQRGYKVGKA